MALPCASVMVITVLLNVAATWATPDVIFLRSFLRGRAVVAGFAMCYGVLFRVADRDVRAAERGREKSVNRDPSGATRGPYLVTFFLPAIATALPLRVRALVWVRWPRTGSPLRWRRPR